MWILWLAIGIAIALFVAYKWPTWFAATDAAAAKVVNSGVAKVANTVTTTATANTPAANT